MRKDTKGKRAFKTQTAQKEKYKLYLMSDSYLDIHSHSNINKSCLKPK